MSARRMEPSPIFHCLSADFSMGYPYGSVLSNGVHEFPSGCKRTVIESRYRLSFLATSYASLLRVIGRRSLVQPSALIFQPSGKCMAAGLDQLTYLT